jgi:RNA polymerase sigma factor (sigma-70 family)
VQANRLTVEDRVVKLYEETRVDVYHYLLRLGLGPAQAQEGAQEVFLRLHSALAGGESIRNPRAWVFRVAHNLAVTEHRAGDRWMALDPGLEAALTDRGPGPEARVLQRERSARLGAALAELSPQQRRCLYLRAEDLRYREIAEALGVGVSTVSQFITRGIARLRRAAGD